MCMVLFPRGLDELNAQQFGAELVKRAIVLSLDRTDRERELVSRLISTLCPSYLSSAQIRACGGGVLVWWDPRWTCVRARRHRLRVAV